MVTEALSPDVYEALRPQSKWAHARAHPMVENDPQLLSFGLYVQHGKDPLRAIVTIDLYDDLQRDGHWLHLSISRERRLPTWGDLCLTRDELGYRELLFIQLVPPASNWLNAHSFCLHLLHRIDRETVPRLLWDQMGADGATYGKPGYLR